MDAKKYRQTHNIEDDEVIKPYLAVSEIKAIETLQRVDIGLLAAGLDYESSAKIYLTNGINKCKRNYSQHERGVNLNSTTKKPSLMEQRGHTAQRNISLLIVYHESTEKSRVLLSFAQSR